MAMPATTLPKFKYPVADPEDGRTVESANHALKIARQRFGRSLDQPDKLSAEAKVRLAAIGIDPDGTLSRGA